VFFALAIMDRVGGGVQAAFAPADSAALKAAVGTCTRTGSYGAYTYSCTGGCLGETPDGSCPTFAASDDGTGNPYGVMGDWDVSRVTSLKKTFYYARAFNADISKWNTARVTTMHTTFWGAAAFNADISKWDTAAVTIIAGTFLNAAAFNADISKWITAAVTTMQGTFYLAAAFNADISKWDTAAVTTMEIMFKNSGFKRTLCGGEWQSLSSNSNLTSTGRLGCCPAGSFMSNPMLNPFLVANSCQQCPAGTGPVSSNDETQCTIGEAPAPSPAADAAAPSSAADDVTPSSAAGAATHGKTGNSKSIHTVMIGVMIAFVTVIFSNAW
jgi:surface protein